MWRRREGPAAAAAVSSNLTARARLELIVVGSCADGRRSCTRCENSTSKENYFPYYGNDIRYLINVIQLQFIGKKNYVKRAVLTRQHLHNFLYPERNTDLSNC